LPHKQLDMKIYHLFSFKAFNVAIVTRFLFDFNDIPILLFDPENV